MLVLNPKAAAQIYGMGQAALGKAALSIEAETKANIQDQGLIDTGNLLNSVQASPTATGWRVSVAAEYAAYPEFGTRYQPPRPYFQPAIDKVSSVWGG